LSIAVRVERVADPAPHWLGELRVRTQDGAPEGVRTIERADETCAPITATLALMAALVLQPSASAPSAAPSPPTTPTPPAPTRAAPDSRAPIAQNPETSGPSGAARGGRGRTVVALTAGAGAGMGLQPGVALLGEASAIVRPRGGLGLFATFVLSSPSSAFLGPNDGATPDGTMLATGGTSTTSTVCSSSTQPVQVIDNTAEVKLWDVATGNLLRTVPTATGGYAYTVKFSRDGSRLVTAGGTESIEIWNATDPTSIGSDASLLATINVSTTYYDVQFSPDGSRIVGAGMGVGGVWSASDGSPVFSIPGLPAEMDDAAYSPDGSEIAAFGDGGRLQFFDANGNLLQSFVAHTVNYMSRVVWVDNDHVVSDDWGGNIKSWTRDATNQFGASGSWSLGSQAFGIAVSPDRSTLAVGGDGGFMFISYAPTEPAVVRLP
ncbi:MAG TPA: WD40 repeat domain-containing protein, partial [Polyangia bacterium]